MLAWVVIDRQHVRQAAPFASLHSSSIFPLPHLSPLLPTPYGHSYTTATQQPLCNQSVTHSFDLDGGCTSLCGNYKSWPQIVRGQPLSHNMLWSRRTKTEYPHRLVGNPSLLPLLYLLFDHHSSRAIPTLPGGAQLGVN